MKSLIRFLVFTWLVFFPISLLLALSNTQAKSPDGVSSARFMGCDPLKNLDSIAINPFYLTNNQTLRSQLYEEVTESLKRAGKIEEIYLDKSFNMKGFSSAQAEMMLYISRIFDDNGKELPAKLSLWIIAETIIEKTGQHCRNPIWMLDTYLSTPFDKLDDQKVIENSVSLLNQFIDDLQEANKDSKKSSVFYLYRLSSSK